MNDNQIIAILIQVIRTGLNLFGMNNVSIKQNHQPVQTGVEPGPVVYLHKINAPRYGFPGRKDVFNNTTNVFDHTETIWRTPTFQVDGLATQNPANITSLTASDIVEATADVLQSSATREALLVSGIGIERITNIRESYFSDERDRFEQSPSFDFTIDYRREFTSTVQEVSRHLLRCHRI